MKYTTYLKMVLFAFFFATHSLMAEVIDIKSYQGMTSVETSPKKIAVFDIPTVDTLTALEIPIHGTVKKLFVDYLDEVSQSAKVVGTLFEPDYKALTLLKPDLIIVGGRSSKTLAKASKIAPTIDMTIYGPSLMEQTRERINSLGKLFNKKEKADALLNELDLAVKKAQEAVVGKGNGLVIMTNGTKLSAFGTQSRFGWIYSTTELEAATDEISIANHGDSISFEFILDLDPDWLLVIDRGSAIGQENKSAQQTLDNEIIHKTKAWKNKQIIYLNSADIYISSGGIQSQLRTLALISNGFNKDSNSLNKKTIQ